MAYALKEQLNSGVGTQGTCHNMQVGTTCLHIMADLPDKVPYYSTAMAAVSFVTATDIFA